MGQFICLSDRVLGLVPCLYFVVLKSFSLALRIPTFCDPLRMVWCLFGVLQASASNFNANEERVMQAWHAAQCFGDSVWPLATKELALYSKHTGDLEFKFPQKNHHQSQRLWLEERMGYIAT